MKKLMLAVILLILLFSGCMTPNQAQIERLYLMNFIMLERNAFLTDQVDSLKAELEKCQSDDDTGYRITKK